MPFAARHAVLGGASTALCPHLALVSQGSRSCRRQKRTMTQRTYAVGWDPEGLLRAPQGGHIARRTLSKEAEKNKELQEEVKRLQLEKEEELREKRESRKAPETHAQIVEYFLETESGEMQFETARLKPLLTPDFFSYLSTQISESRFGSSPNEDRTAELEGLKDFLEATVKLIDSRTQELSAPAERMRRLLTAPDKKAALLEMAGNNEIDKSLLDLLSQNIAAARAAGQEDPALFMEKVRDAAKKFVLVS